MNSVFFFSKKALSKRDFHILIFPILATWEFFALILRIICWILQTVKSLLINLIKKHIDNCFAPEIIRCSIFSQWNMSYLSPVDAKVAQCTWFTLDYRSPILCRSHHHRCHWHHEPSPSSSPSASSSWLSWPRSTYLTQQMDLLEGSEHPPHRPNKDRERATVWKLKKNEGKNRS